MAEAAKTYADLVSLIEKSEKEYDLALIEKAYKFAEAAHQGQVRRSGEPYIIHPIAVAYKLGGIRHGYPVRRGRSAA